MGPAAVWAQTWTTIDCPGALHTRARSINDRGDIVGICEDEEGEHGFLLRQGVYTMFDFPGTAGTTVAFGINNRGDVVGRYFDDEGHGAHGYLLRRGTFSTIDPPDTSFSPARGIDDLGRIVGVNLGTDGVVRGYVLDVRGFHDIEIPDADTVPWDINNRGRIVGGYFDFAAPVGTHGFLLKNGVLTTIDVPGAAGTFAFGINILNRIVGGWSVDPDCQDCFTQAFLLTPQGFEFLEFPDALETVATGINARGQIVGFYFREDETFHGFLRDAGDDD